MIDDELFARLRHELNLKTISTGVWVDSSDDRVLVPDIGAIFFSELRINEDDQWSITLTNVSGDARTVVLTEDEVKTGPAQGAFAAAVRMFGVEPTEPALPQIWYGACNWLAERTRGKWLDTEVDPATATKN
jgi:hypothetical protein